MLFYTDDLISVLVVYLKQTTKGGLLSDKQNKNINLSELSIFKHKYLL